VSQVGFNGGSQPLPANRSRSFICARGGPLRNAEPERCASVSFKLQCLGRQRFFTLSRRKNTAEAETTVTPEMTEATTEKKQPAKTSKKGVPVSPEKLMEITSKMEGNPSDVIAQACGYYTEITTTATGDVEVRVTVEDNFAFMQALLAAQGTKLAPPARPSRRTSRQPIIKIGKTGNIVVGSRYTTVAGFPFGEDVESKVRVEAEAGKITILAAAAEDYSSTEAEEADEEESDLDF
jgi:hypothetical protein